MGLPKNIEVPIYEFTCKSSDRVIKYKATKYVHQKIFGIALETSLQEEKEENATKIINDVLKQVLSDCLVGEELDNLTFTEIEELWLNIRGSSSTRELVISYKATPSCKEQGHEPDNVSAMDILNYTIESESGKTLDEVAAEHGMVKKGDNWVIKITPQVGMTLGIPMGFKKPGDDMVTKCIVNIFDDQNVYDEFTAEELDEFMGSLPMNLLEPIEEFSKSLPTVCLESKIECKDCKYTRHNKLKGIYDFFG